MSKREQKWSKKYRAVLVNYHGDEVRLGISQLGYSVELRPGAGYKLLYRNPAAPWERMDEWVRNAPLHPDYFGYQEPPAEPAAPELLAMETDVVAKRALSLEFAAPAYGKVVYVDDGDRTYRVRFPYVVTSNGPCRNATFWCRADQVEAL